MRRRFYIFLNISSGENNKNQILIKFFKNFQYVSWMNHLTYICIRIYKLYIWGWFQDFYQSISWKLLNSGFYNS